MRPEVRSSEYVHKYSVLPNYYYYLHRYVLNIKYIRLKIEYAYLIDRPNAERPYLVWEITLLPPYPGPNQPETRLLCRVVQHEYCIRIHLYDSHYDWYNLQIYIRHLVFRAPYSVQVHNIPETSTWRSRGLSLNGSKSLTIKTQVPISPTHPPANMKPCYFPVIRFYLGMSTGVHFRFVF